MRDSKGIGKSASEAASRAASGACSHFAEVIWQDRMQIASWQCAQENLCLHFCSPAS